jgi:hypothetical protein
MFVFPAKATASGGIDTGDIGHSLRFRSAASAYLSRTFGTPTSASVFSFSAWIKRGALGGVYGILAGAGTNKDVLYFNSTSDTIKYILNSSTVFETSAVFRDPTSHFNLLLIQNGTAATLYINGVSVATGTGTRFDINGAVAHTIGSYNGSANHLDGYLSRVCFVDGQALTPSSFGYLNTDINEWVTKTKSEIRAAVLAGGGARNGWGANGSMKDFSDATSLTTLGYDISQADDGTGGNHWTLSGHSLTAGVTYDHMLDSPSHTNGGSYPVWNAIANFGGMTLSDGNLKAASSSVSRSILTTIPCPADVITWHEITVTSIATNGFVGLCKYSVFQTAGANGNELGQVGSLCYRLNGDKYVDGTGSAYGSSYTSGDVIGILVNPVAGTVTFYKQTGGSGNFVSQGAITYATSSGDYFIDTYVYNGNVSYNGGQRTFNYVTQHGALPSSAVALCQANLPDVDTALLNPEDHHIDITVTKSGDTNFTLPWDASVYDTFFEIKRRDAAGDWYQIDGLRGYDKILKSNSTAAETTDANVLGVSGTTCTLKSTLANGTYVISATKAGLSASRQTNTDGSITSTVSRNVDSGFSIVTYTGTGVAATLGHGLGDVAKLVVAKNRSVSGDWEVRHYAIAATKSIYLNLTSAETTSSVWNNTAPTSTVFSVGVQSTPNGNGNSLVAYCYADSAIQKSFSYTGNASADGVNPFLGFKCGTTTVKNTGLASNWFRWDSARNTYNPVGVSGQLYPNLDSIEGSNTDLDFISNSLKFRNTSSSYNSSSYSYIGHAWAATTGKYSLAR